MNKMEVLFAVAFPANINCLTKLHATERMNHRQIISEDLNSEFSGFCKSLVNEHLSIITKKEAGAKCSCLFFKRYVFNYRLATNLGFATSVNDDLHRVTAAGPSVGSDLTAKQATSPAHGRCFGAATRHAYANLCRAAAAWRLYAQRGLDGWWWAAIAASIAAGKAGVGHADHRGHGDCGYYRNSTNSKHVFLSPL